MIVDVEKRLPPFQDLADAVSRLPEPELRDLLSRQKAALARLEFEIAQIDEALAQRKAQNTESSEE